MLHRFTLKQLDHAITIWSKSTDKHLQKLLNEAKMEKARRVKQITKGNTNETE
jgi:hypothetical protein